MLPSFLICGPEHSGTTLLSDIFRQTSKYDSGFECGVLLADSPSAFRSMEPFVSNIKRGWKIGSEDLDYVCAADNFEKFYSRLVERSSLGLKRNIFDKTPRYLVKLSDVRAKIDKPIFICYKDPRSIVASDFIRSQDENFDVWFEQYCNKKKIYMTRLYENYMRVKNASIRDCYLVRLEDLCLDTKRTLNEIFKVIDEVFDLRYLNFENVRYRHNKSQSIATNIPFNYYKILTKNQLLKIEREFALFDDWFYS
jgi:hypothetical protein